MQTQPAPGPVAATLIRATLAVGNLYRRLLGVVFGVIGPRAAYRFVETVARWMYGLLDPLREISEAHCRAALGALYSPEALTRIAGRAFVHRAWNLADLLLTPRLINRHTYARFGGRLPEADLRVLLAAQRRREPVILLTGYYGPFDLLPVFLGYSGVRAAVVYRPHPNAGYDRLRQSVRGSSGCEQIPVGSAWTRVPGLLAAGRTVALIADHHGGERDLPVTFLGIETRAIRSVALLACRYEASIAVAGVRRVQEEFRFEIVVSDTIDPVDWADQRDPTRYITDRYLRALERVILAEPSQYLWGYARWGPEKTGELLAGGEPDP